MRDTRVYVTSISDKLVKGDYEMRQHHQDGYLRCRKRKSGPFRWEYLWCEDDEFGNRIRRTSVIGSTDQYPTRESAASSVNGNLTMMIVLINQ